MCTSCTAPQGKYQQAEPLYRRCQAIQETVLGLEHPSLAITLGDRAWSLGKQVRGDGMYRSGVLTCGRRRGCGWVVMWANVEWKCCVRRGHRVVAVSDRDVAGYCWPCRHRFDGRQSCARRRLERLGDTVGPMLTVEGCVYIVYWIAGQVPAGGATVGAVSSCSREGSRTGTPRLGHHSSRPCYVAWATGERRWNVVVVVC